MSMRVTKRKIPQIPLADALRHLAAKVAVHPIVNIGGRLVRSVTAACRRGLATSGLNGDIMPYALRKSMACHLADRGVPPDPINTLCGGQLPYLTQDQPRLFLDVPLTRQLKHEIDATFADLQKFTRHRLLPIR